MIRISRRSPADPGVIAVAIHDVEPANFERCALIRDWLDDHGITCATLLVVPAPGLHPRSDRCGEFVDWLDERRRAGDWIARNGSPDVAVDASGHCRHGAGLALLDVVQMRRSVELRHRSPRLAGIRPSGRRSPWVMRRRAAGGATVLRLDLHPADLERRQKVAAVEAVLRNVSGRRAVTLAEIDAAG